MPFALDFLIQQYRYPVIHKFGGESGGGRGIT